MFEVAPAPQPARPRYRYAAVSRLRPDEPYRALALAPSADLAVAGAEAYLEECARGRPGRPSDVVTIAALRRHLIVADEPTLDRLGFNLAAAAAEPEGELCPGCAVEIEAAHLPGCDFEQCPLCGGQLTACGHAPAVAPRQRLPWPGELPGSADARAFGWFVRLVDGRWEPCGPDAIGATPDLERVYGPDARWDPTARRFVRVEGAGT